MECSGVSSADQPATRGVMSGELGNRPERLRPELRQLELGLLGLRNRNSLAAVHQDDLLRGYSEGGGLWEASG
jgi:hypothetical protein